MRICLQCKQEGKYTPPRKICNTCFENNMKNEVQFCVKCKKKICKYCKGPGGQHDHVTPLSRGGPHSIENIVPCCQKCNDSKLSKTPEEWVARWYE